MSDELWLRRRQEIQKICKSNPVMLKRLREQAENRPEHSRAQSRNIYNTKLISNIVHVEKLNLNWCLVPKAASTSISSVLLPYLSEMINTTDTPQHKQGELWERAGHLTLSDYLENNNNTPAFLVTRHPLYRIASAYRNKIENRTRHQDGQYFYQTYSTKIIR